MTERTFTLMSQDSERFADDVERIATELGQGYEKMGKELPHPGRILLQAQCVWSVMTFEQMLHKRLSNSKPATVVGLDGRRLV